MIAYDRLIEDEKALYITFDNVEVGRLQAEAIFGLVPKGNYVIIKGNKADANADFLRSGMDKVIADAVAAGDIKIVGETYTDNWDPAKAQTEMEQFLTANNNDVQAVLAENDGMAGGVVVGARGAEPRREGSGVGSGRRPGRAQPRRPRHPDRARCGRTPASSARQLATRPSRCARTPTPRASRAPHAFTTPGGIDVSSILLKPQPITQDNLDVVIDAGWTTKDNVCKDVPAGSVAACG